MGETNFHSLLPTAGTEPPSNRCGRTLPTASREIGARLAQSRTAQPPGPHAPHPGFTTACFPRREFTEEALRHYGGRLSRATALSVRIAVGKVLIPRRLRGGQQASNLPAAIPIVYRYRNRVKRI